MDDTNNNEQAPDDTNNEQAPDDTSGTEQAPEEAVVIGTYRQLFELEYLTGNTVKKYLLRSFRISDIDGTSNSSAMLREITGKTLFYDSDGNTDFHGYLSNIVSMQAVNNVTVSYTVGST